MTFRLCFFEEGHYEITRWDEAYVEKADHFERRLAVIVWEQLRVCHVFEVVLQTQTAQRLNLIFMCIIAHPISFIKNNYGKATQELIITPHLF